VEEHANGSGARRGPLETALLAGLGWASLSAQAADDLADDLARLAGLDRDELRHTVREALAGWRRDVERAGGRREEAAERLVGRLGLARREEVRDLELRVAQLEHRLKLLEDAPRTESG
jgi:polyhydroxyalkanoate synthesis regulator phasin